MASIGLALLLPISLSAQRVNPQGLGTPGVASTDSATWVPVDPKPIQDRVNELLTRMAMPNQSVHVDIVRSDERMISVATVDEDGTFHLSLDTSFLECLSEDELIAALAHELGHVWVFTHHPYLQTEKLANEIAMRVVTRDSLARLYEKMWQRQGTKGDLVHVLGE